MNLIAFILLVVAAILFAVEFFKSNGQNLTALGLCLLTVGLVAQYASSDQTVRF